MNRDFKGIWIEKELYLVDKKTLSWPDKILLKEIHSFTTDGQGCFASNEYLANFVGVTEGTLANMKTKLRKMGLIENVAFDGRKMTVQTTDDFIARLKLLPQMGESRVHLEMKAGFIEKGSQDSCKNEHNNTVSNSVNNSNNIKDLQIQNLRSEIEELKAELLKQTKEEEKRKNSAKKKKAKYEKIEDVPYYQETVELLKYLDLRAEKSKGHQIPTKPDNFVRYGGYKSVKKALKQFTVEELKAVIDFKCKEWLNDSTYRKYLTHETLFGKAEKYLDQIELSKTLKPQTNGKQQNHSKGEKTLADIFANIDAKYNQEGFDPTNSFESSGPF